MYLDYYKLDEQPFGVTPNPRYLYLSSTHREAIASVWHGVMENRGFTAMIAHPGMGKTTLLFQLLQKAPPTLKTVFLFQTQCSPRDLLRNVLADLGVSSDGQDLARMQAQLNEVLLQESAAGRRVVVVVDEAQNLDEAALEVLRVLSNFETSDEKLMHVVLAGQPELAKKLASPNMVQLRQRVSIVVRLAPFKASETRDYIEHRLRISGYSAPRPLFSDRACDLIAVHSQGIPRNINNICFNAMALACALQKKMIGPEIIREVLDDLDLEGLTKQPYCPESAVRSIDRPMPNSRRLAIGWLRGALIRTGLIVAASTLCLSILSAACNVGEPGGLVGVANAPVVVTASNSPDLSENPKTPEVSSPDAKLKGGTQFSSSPLATGEGDSLLLVQIGPRETLYGICIRYFGRYDGKLLQEMKALNPGLGDPKRIRAGRTVRLPAQQVITVAEQKRFISHKVGGENEMSRNFELLQRTAASSNGLPASEIQGLLAMEPQAAEKEKSRVRTTLGLDEIAREEVSKLVQTVFHPQEGPRRSVLFAAINSGSGCTWICSQIAAVLAATVSEPVCIVDANFRTPSRRGLLGATNHCGLSDALRTQRPVREFVKQLEPQNLWLLPCGSGPEASVSLLTSDKMSGLVTELRKEFGYVLMDLPPLSTYADGISLSHLADGLVLVLEANVTRREVALQVADRLRGMKIKVLGAVLNKRTFPIPESVYHRI